MSKKPLFFSLGILLSGVSVFAQNTYYRDADQDGYGNPSMTVSAASAPEGYVSVSGDCNDGNVAVHMGAPEVCDGLDNDCDGAVDESGTTIFYRDADGDGYGNIYPTVTACFAPAGYVNNSNDCNDSDNTIYPGAIDIPDDGINQSCDNSIACFVDADNDGYRTYSTITSADCDCNDDGEALPSDPAGDCYDNNAAMHPGNTEVCDGFDNDCDGAVDEGAFTIFYRDFDGDGHGNVNQTVTACPAPSGYVSSSDDCNDSDNTIYPGAPEIPGDDIDQNCDGTETCYADADNDGYRTTSTITSADCDCNDDGEAKASEPTGDCDDGNSAIHPGVSEVCDGLDNDCDAVIDESVTTPYYRDADGDGYGNVNLTVSACAAPTGYVNNSDDCNDSDNTIYPGAPEIPGDEIDQTCDGTETCYADADNDGYRTTSVISSADCDCNDDGEAKASEPTGDCDDGDAAINPGAEEICDGKDNNCDGISFQDTENTITENACKSYTAPDGTVYTTTGIKTAVIPNAAGCDSLITIDLTVNSIDIAVTQNSNILTALASPAYYKWLDCDNDYNPITNENNQTFIADVSGNYAVEITQNECIDTSMCYNVSIISTIENTFDKSLVVYPNPTNGFFSIDLGASLQKIEIDVKDMNGRIVKKSRFRNRQFLDFELDEPAGIYIITITSENKIAIIKLIKK